MDTIATISSNEMLEAGAYFTSPTYGTTTTMEDLITANIKKDYQNGNTVGNIELFMANFEKVNYPDDESSNGSLDWFSGGEVIKVGDMLKITKNEDNDETYFDSEIVRVTNREIVYNGEVYVEIDFQALNTISTEV